MTTWHARTPAAHDFLAAATAAPDSVLVALDFDGTLAPIVDDPETSAMHPEAADALAGLGPKVGQVAIITGRPVAKVRQLGQLERRAGLGGVIVMGQYGAERWDARTGVETPPETPQSVAVATVQIERALADLGLPGVHLEDKGQAIGIHVRRCPDPVAAFADAEARRRADRRGQRTGPRAGQARAGVALVLDDQGRCATCTHRGDRAPPSWRCAATEEVDAMRTARAQGISVIALAKQFGVHRGTVWAKSR